MVDSIALSLFGGSTATGSSGISGDLLAAWALARTQSAASVKVSTADPNAPVAPWEIGYPMPEDEALANAALSGGAFFDLAAARYADPGVEGDYARLFALHSGLKTLSALTTMLQNDKLNSVERARIEKTFARGQAELEQFFATQKFEDVRLAMGDRQNSVGSKLGVPIVSEDYITAPLHRGRLTDTIAGLPSDAQFDIVVKSAAGATQTVTIDLAQMGALPRSLGGIVNFINARLSAAGVQTRIEALNQAPKTVEVNVGGTNFTRPYTGAGEYALKIDVKGGETIAFSAPDTRPAFYAVGQSASGARLIKLEDMMGAAGEPAVLARPPATADPIGAAMGFIGAGAPYQSAPASAWEKRTFTLVDAAHDTNTETALAKAGDAQLTVRLADGRKITVSTAWRDESLESWRVRDGENEDVARLDDLAERLTQLLHEQGVAAGLDLWHDGSTAGLSLFTNDAVRVEKLTIAGRAISLENGREPEGGLEAGLRGGVFTRRFETEAVEAAGELFTGKQAITITAAGVSYLLSVDAGDDGLTGDDLAAQFNEQIAQKGLAARAAIVTQGGDQILRIDALHDVTSVSTRLNEETHAGVLAAPGAWASGGLPIGALGAFTSEQRSYTATGGAPLALPGNDGALEIAITVETGAGDKVVTLSVSAEDRTLYPDASSGVWDDELQARLDAALNAAGLYVSSASLNDFTIAESSGQRLKSVEVNGQAVTYDAAAPASLGGAFDSVRSFSSAILATQTSDVTAALTNNPSVSITLDTIWGERVVSASLEPGDPRTLESAALRLNEALAAAGYDAGVEAADFSGGAGLRIVS
ncbi:MAG: hypothetical protein AB7T08_11405, partial [Hyphomonadaceae bacterium]